MRRGWFRVGSVRGVPVRVHWSTPIGLFVLTGFSFAPTVWAALLFVFFVHEMGHAVAVRARRLGVLEIAVHGLGGECRWEGHASRADRIWIAWGGPLAQLALLVAALVVQKLFPTDAPSGAMASILATCVTINAFVLALNLLPIPPLDGATAWAILDPRPALDWIRRRARRPRSDAAALREALRRAAAARDNPRYGRRELH